MDCGISVIFYNFQTFRSYLMKI